MPDKDRYAFTLIEIMIVVLIIGILLFIAVPNVVKARESSRRNSCLCNLTLMDAAKQQWAMDKKKHGSDTPNLTDLIPSDGSVGYIQSPPTCPSKGNYILGSVDTPTLCTATPRDGFTLSVSQ